MTFAHVLSPEVTYAEAKPLLYRRLQKNATRALDAITPKHLSIPVVFDTILAFHSAIIVKSHDDGTYDTLRQAFVEEFELPEQTRRPPKIIHITIARFRKELDFAQLQDFTAGVKVSLKEGVAELQLVHEKKIFLQEHDVIARYPCPASL